MLYLNEGFKGGNTQFFEKHTNKPNHFVAPQTGLAIVFYQNSKLPHIGEAITEGRKYIMRTDIMYRCIEDRSNRNQ